MPNKPLTQLKKDQLSERKKLYNPPKSTLVPFQVNVKSSQINITVIRGEKGTQTQTFWSRYLRVRWGVLHVKGRGPKSLVCPSKPRETNIFSGISRDFAGISRVCPKSWRKEVCVQFLSPKLANFNTAICGKLWGSSKNQSPLKEVFWGVTVTCGVYSI